MKFTKHKTEIITALDCINFVNLKRNWNKRNFAITWLNKLIENKIISLVDSILSTKKQNPDADTSLFEKSINQLVYELYEITDEEIKFIEN